MACRRPAVEGDGPNECIDGADNDTAGLFDCEDEDSPAWAGTSDTDTMTHLVVACPPAKR